MSLYQVFDIAGSGMNAQTLRLNVTASNLSNAQSVSGTEKGAYRARTPVFAPLLNKNMDEQLKVAGVYVKDIVEVDKPARSEFQPDHPLADDNGYVYFSNVNTMTEMANMMSAARSYQNNVEIANAAKKMLSRTLELGR